MSKLREEGKSHLINEEIEEEQSSSDCSDLEEDANSPPFAN
jgi:hypothetical protein